MPPSNFDYTTPISPRLVNPSRVSVNYFVNFVPNQVWAIEQVDVVEGSVFAINCVFNGASSLAQPSGYGVNQQQVWVYKRGNNVSSSVLSDSAAPGYVLSPGNIMITANFQNLVGGNIYVVVIETSIDGGSDIQRRKFQINVSKDEDTP